MRWLATTLLLVSTSAFGWMCDPQQIAGGTGTRAIVKTDAAGFAVMWACPDNYSPPLARTVQFWGRWIDLVPAWKEILTAAVLGTPADREAAYKQYVTVAQKDASGAYLFPADLAGVVTPAYEELKLIVPPAPIWKVAPNGSFTTRPAYAVTDGVRAATGTARATVGAACYCGLRFVEGSTTYCAVTTTGSWVSVCQRQ